mmetsp:Transcript_3662/g.6948  ORF Transcript_3662/g.6948 Transcript_3662/m.6948 type:complete len:463 (-) Transcript_3662:43-1431(-)
MANPESTTTMSSNPTDSTTTTTAAVAKTAAAVQQPESNQTDVLEERIINDEYKVWKKNSPYLYDLVMTSALEWPSLTCQWLPTLNPSSTKTSTEHSLLLGTHTNDEQNYLMVASVGLPTEDAEIDAREYVDEKEECGGFGSTGNKVEVKIKIMHEGEVHRARYCPSNPFLVATKSPSPDVYVFDLSKHPSFPTAGSSFNPQHVLQGHTSEGYGLAWSPHPSQPRHLISAGEDKLLCLWDLASAGATVPSLSKLTGHTDVVEDVAWHQTDPSIVGSVGDDRSIKIWDIRVKNSSGSTHTRSDAHEADINSIAFNPVQEYLFATGSGDNDVGLWDLRNLKEPLSLFKGHTAEVFNVAWAPFGEGTILGSASADRRVNIWDLARIGQEQTPEDAEDGPPELLFIHGGHTSKLNDLSFNANDDWIVASVSDDNVLQVWSMAENIYADYDDEEADGELDDADLEDDN